MLFNNWFLGEISSWRLFEGIWSSEWWTSLTAVIFISFRYIQLDSWYTDDHDEWHENRIEFFDIYQQSKSFSSDDRNLLIIGKSISIMNIPQEEDIEKLGSPYELGNQFEIPSKILRLSNHSTFMQLFNNFLHFIVDIFTWDWNRHQHDDSTDSSISSFDKWMSMLVNINADGLPDKFIFYTKISRKSIWQFDLFIKRDTRSLTSKKIIENMY